MNMIVTVCFKNSLFAFGSA